MNENYHTEPCRDLVSLSADVKELQHCYEILKNRSVPRWVFIIFVGGIVTVSVTFITWHVSALRAINKENIVQNERLYDKIDNLNQALVDLKLQQEVFNTKQQQVIYTLQSNLKYNPTPK
jgi:hypothetical protein